MLKIISKLKQANPVCRMLQEHKAICESTQRVIIEKGLKKLQKETKPC